jgi:hypothetical protein
LCVFSPGHLRGAVSAFSQRAATHHFPISDVLHGEGGITLAILVPLNLIAAGLWPFAMRRYV